MAIKRNQCITIKDIARTLNVSVSTVSRALNDTFDVSAETKQKVLTLAKDLHYKPNPNAIGLANNKTHNIGVILPYITNYYFSTVMTGIQKVAWSKHYNVILYVTNDSAEMELAILESLSYSSLDGLVVCLSSPANSSECFQHIINLGIPIVFFDRIASGVPTSKVMQDDYNGAFEAVEHLIEHGYRKIAHISGPEGFPVTEKREQGYRDALMKHNLLLREEWIIRSGFSQEHGEEDVNKLMDAQDRPDAIFAVNDSKAIGAMLCLKKRRIKIGEEVGVIGFTNDPIGNIISPSLSTMAEPAPLDVGTQSCELLMQHILKKSFSAKEIVLPCKLIVRESTVRSVRVEQ